MEQMQFREMAEFISNNVRLKTSPVAVKFLKETDAFPEKTRRPSTFLNKRVAICQAVTMARVYGWTMGLTKDDLICVPAMLAFGFTSAPDPAEALEWLLCQMNFAKDEAGARKEVASLSRFANEEYKAMVLAPLQKGLFEPDTVVLYGNPAQIMRLVQAMVYGTQRRIPGNFGGKVECSEYLIAPFKNHAPRIAIPGNGDRIFSMTQDDEMVFSIPGELLGELVEGLKESGKMVGARYPVTFYQNFQPEFPKPHKELGRELGIFS
jgi:uncharacterized protein (DUF169 family)